MGAVIKKTIKLTSILLILIWLFCGCSAGYIARAAYEQAKIMAKREPIDALIADAETDPLTKRKLILVKEAREFARELGLEPKNTFTKYAKLDSDILAWILLASKTDAFELYTWWFPIVGIVPYKGFFNVKDAESYAKGLLEKGYEVSVRGTSAFSTLGWFDDPILSSTLKNDEVAIVNTVIHESFHTTLWVKNKVDFNESIANFIGTLGACEFFKDKLKKCEPLDQNCYDRESILLLQCYKQKEMHLEFAGIVTELYEKLNSLYRSDKTKEEKLKLRQDIFDSYIKPLRLRYPEMKALQKINNAEIMQFKLYVSGFKDFLSFYGKNDSDLKKTVRRLINNSEKIKNSPNPYSELNSLS